MEKAVVTIALLLAFIPFGHAQESIGDKAHEAKTEAVKAKHAAGKKIRHTGRKARQAVFTRCADGRHTVKGASGCARHGGVRDPK